MSSDGMDFDGYLDIQTGVFWFNVTDDITFGYLDNLQAGIAISNAQVSGVSSSGLELTAGSVWVTATVNDSVDWSGSVGALSGSIDVDLAASLTFEFSTNGDVTCSLSGSASGEIQVQVGASSSTIGLGSVSVSWTATANLTQLGQEFENYVSDLF